MQPKVALRARVAELERRLEADSEARRRLRRELVETRYRLRLARAGLLIALPHVAHPAARALVAYALEDSDTPDPTRARLIPFAG